MKNKTIVSIDNFEVRLSIPDSQKFMLVEVDSPPKNNLYYEIKFSDKNFLHFMSEIKEFVGGEVFKNDLKGDSITAKQGRVSRSLTPIVSGFILLAETKDIKNDNWIRLTKYKAAELLERYKKVGK